MHVIQEGPLIPLFDKHHRHCHRHFYLSEMNSLSGIVFRRISSSRRSELIGSDKFTPIGENECLAKLPCSFRTPTSFLFWHRLHWERQWSDYPRYVVLLSNYVPKYTT